MSNAFDALPKLSQDDLAEQLLDIASSAALKVGDMLIEASAEASAGTVAIEEKENIHDLVTLYDRESERMIVEHIVKHYPDSTVIGEEAGVSGDGAVRWYIDPLDGTSNFAAGIPFFCVSIGAVLNDRPLAAVIFDPIRRELFTASGRGSFLNGEPIRARGNESDSKALLLTAFPSPHAGVLDTDSKLFSQLIERFATVRRIGSAALSLAYVACGRADVVFEPHINPWDVAAGILLVEQAGGRAVSFGQANSGTRQHSWLLPKIIAACPEFDLNQSMLKVFLSREGSAP